VKVAGDVQLVAAAPSSEQVVLVTVPLVDQAKRAVDAAERRAGTDVSVTVGRVVYVVPLVTVQVYEDDALPAPFATVTLNECVPGASPAYDFGDTHAAATPSSVQVVLVTVPVVDQANVAEVAVVEDAGTLVSATLGAELDGAVTVHEYVALTLPLPFATVTRNECPPLASPL